LKLKMVESHLLKLPGNNLVILGIPANYKFIGHG
jgi:hypothetical protein